MYAVKYRSEGFTGGFNGLTPAVSLALAKDAMDRILSSGKADVAQLVEVDADERILRTIGEIIEAA